MNMNLKFATFAVFSFGLIASASAQNKPSKSSTVHHAKVRHRSSGVAPHEDSRKLNADLAKLESQTSQTTRARRSAPQSKRVVPGKAVNQQDRRANPPINFSYNGKGAHTSSSGGSHRTSANSRRIR